LPDFAAWLAIVANETGCARVQVTPPSAKGTQPWFKGGRWLIALGCAVVLVGVQFLPCWSLTELSAVRPGDLSAEIDPGGKRAIVV
jgi:hypothetical protein